MTDRATAVLCLVCHHLKLLQACTQRVIVDWPVDLMRAVLDNAMEFEKTVNSLADDEITAIFEFLPQLQPVFLHLSLSNMQIHDIRHAFNHFLQTLIKNPYLSEAHRDCVFEYCLDHSIEVPKFQPVPELVLRAPPYVLSLIECRLFVRHLMELDNRGQLWLFLDSCFVLDPDYLCHLVLSVLERLISENRQQLTSRVADWLTRALSRSNHARICLIKLDPVRVRDLCIALPSLRDPILTVLDPRDPIHVENGEPSASQVTDFLCCLMTVTEDSGGILKSLSTLASMEPSSHTFWKTVIREVNLKYATK